MTKVLIIDDEPGYRANLHFFLTRAGNDVRAAPTASAAIEMAAEFHPDVLVADWLLSERQTGLDVSRQLRKENPDLKTIIITGLSADTVRSHSPTPEVFRYVEKPFEPQELISAVRDAAEVK